MPVYSAGYYLNVFIITQYYIIKYLERKFSEFNALLPGQEDTLSIFFGQRL